MCFWGQLQRSEQTSVVKMRVIWFCSLEEGVWKEDDRAVKAEERDMQQDADTLNYTGEVGKLDVDEKAKRYFLKSWCLLLPLEGLEKLEVCSICQSLSSPSWIKQMIRKPSAQGSLGDCVLTVGSKPVVMVIMPRMRWSEGCSNVDAEWLWCWHSISLWLHQLWPESLFFKCGPREPIEWCNIYKVPP